MTKLRDGEFLLFDEHLPIYNWHYPLLKNVGVQYKGRDVARFVEALATPLSTARSVALYFHIPFCETICRFCPFVRGEYRHIDEVGAYTDALTREIALRAPLLGGRGVPVRAIYFGGGTPSVLSAAHMRQIFEAIHHHFNLSGLREMTFELEAKSIDAEKMAVAAKAGVNRISFGVQTFTKRYRSLFNLTATSQDIERAARLSQEIIGNYGIDIMYGFDGQTSQEVLADLEAAMRMQPETINYYPINNLTTQIGLHQRYTAAGLSPKSAADKLVLRAFGDAVLRSRGYHPCNGHSYVRSASVAPGRVVASGEHFLYHDIMHGYAGDMVIGFGASAFSYIGTHATTNEPGRSRYIQQLAAGHLPHGHAEPIELRQTANRGYAVHLPYAGFAEKALLSPHETDTEVLSNLATLVAKGLIVETPTEYALTALGHLWYVNIMYQLTPSGERELLDQFVRRLSAEPGRRDGTTRLIAI